jgi:hypothetical protein
MRIDYFEQNCEHLLDSDDATKALGTVSIFKGRKTERRCAVCWESLLCASMCRGLQL